MGNLLGKKVPKKPPCTEFRDCPDELDSCIKNFQEGCEGLMAQCVLDTDCKQRSEISQRHPHLYMYYSPTRLGSVSPKTTDNRYSKITLENVDDKVLLTDHITSAVAREIRAEREAKEMRGRQPSMNQTPTEVTNTRSEPKQDRTPTETVRRKSIKVVPDKKQVPEKWKKSGICHHGASPESLPEGTCCGPGGYVVLGRHEPGKSKCKTRPPKII